MEIKAILVEDKSKMPAFLNDSQATYNRHFKGLNFCLKKLKNKNSNP
jgi:hypothetical protein